MPGIFRYIYLPLLFLFPLRTIASPVSQGKGAGSSAIKRYAALHVKKDSTAKKDTSNKSDFVPVNKDFVLQPLLGIGTGLLSYFGNVNAPVSKVQNPMTSRIGYDLQYSQKLNPVMEFNLYALFGQLCVNTRSSDMNWNFLSSIEGGGARLIFKLLPKQNLTPYILTGVESFEFLTKTSLYNNQGTPYYYWSDGSIRSLPQSSPMASSATQLQWNYNYSSDMRSLNIGNTGKYQTQTFAIPLGVGFMFHLCNNADFMIGTTLNYTFTNHIDGLGDSTGGRKHDMFFMTSFGLRFDLSKNRKTKVSGINGHKRQDRYAHPDAYYAGVDFDALAQDTIKPVSDKAPTLTDSAILRQYQMYEDSTGQFAQIIVENTIGNPAQIKPHPQPSAHVYSIQLARYSKGVPPDVMDKLMSIPNVTSEAMPDSSTAYIVGNFTDMDKAKASQQQYVQNGLPDAKIVYRKDKDYVPAANPPPGQEANKVPVSNNPPVNPVQPNNNPAPGNVGPAMNAGTIVYRVQLGAYKHKLPREVFMNIDNIVEVKTENGYFTYSAGSFTKYQDAVDYKTKLTALGYPNLFIKAYQNGKRIPLPKAEAPNENSPKEDLNEEVTHETSSLDKSKVSFDVVLAALKGAPSREMSDKFKTIDGYRTIYDSASGLTYYIAGHVTDINDAKAMQAKLAAAPLLNKATVGACYMNKPIPVEQAVDILKQ